ncbi:MAG TPA: glycoside hydrolase family 16 protein [Phycisphaerae bacterium]|nr:glycoside hydrolase family 16 protein [Phycisphaerae bacterium]
MVRVPIREVDTVFANPGQGWMSQTPLSGVRVSGERELVFGGYPWTVRSGHGGPGPNAWATDNVWLDAATNLHLKIAHREGKWSCAEVTLQQRLGFGRYRFQTVGRIDRLDDNVVLGLFNYPTREVGPDATHEIDIEFARWGEAGNPLGNFTVWPVERGLKPVSKAFPVALTGDEATHGFHWGHRQIVFQSANGHREDQREAISTWTYRPSEPARFISRQPMPVHLNLWLFQGRPPKDGQEVEVIIRGFKHTPDGP